MKKFLSKAFLCFSLLLLNNVAYAQSDDSLWISDIIHIGSCLSAVRFISFFFFVT